MRNIVRRHTQNITNTQGTLCVYKDRAEYAGPAWLGSVEIVTRFGQDAIKV